MTKRRRASRTQITIDENPLETPRKECGGGWPPSRAWRAWFPATAHAMFTRKGHVLRSPPHDSLHTVRSPHLTGRKIRLHRYGGK